MRKLLQKTESLEYAGTSGVDLRVFCGKRQAVVSSSVYLVDRTIPMLPERLCNFICSLRPNEEKLAFSVIFDITEKGEVRDSRIVHTVINSDRRFTYEEAQQIIETKTGDFKEEVLMLDTIAKALREKRFAAGAINFDRYEVKFEIDEKGKPISVYFKESKDANKLVEDSCRKQALQDAERQKQHLSDRPHIYESA